jgi:hypothetical protein
MKTAQLPKNLPLWQDRLGRSFMILASAGAIGAFSYGIKQVQVATPDTIWVKTWRMLAFLVFAGMFALLAFRPRLSAGVWELVLFHKLAMVVSAIFMLNVKEASIAAPVDTALVLLIIGSYILTRGWRSWYQHEAF